MNNTGAEIEINAKLRWPADGWCEYTEDGVSYKTKLDEEENRNPNLALNIALGIKRVAALYPRSLTVLCHAINEMWEFGELETGGGNLPDAKPVIIACQKYLDRIREYDKKKEKEKE